METTISSALGFNVDTMAGFKDYAAVNPNEVVLGVEARSIWEGQGGDTLAKIGPWSMAGQRIDKPTRDYALQFGAWKEVTEAIGVERAMDKLEPVEVALAAVCSCVSWAICINAAQEGLELEGLEVSARATLDPRVLLSILPVEDASSCLRQVEMEIHATGNLSEADRVRIAEMAKRSPVHALITYANSIFTKVVVG